MPRYSVRTKSGQRMSLGEGEMILYSAGQAIAVIIKAVFWLSWQLILLVIRGARRVYAQARGA